MNFGICTLSVIPCRKEPSSTSEMVTQLLFGETYTIIEDKENWLSITTHYDNYPCWISAKQHTGLSNADFKKIATNTLSSELVYELAPILNALSLKLGNDAPMVIGKTDWLLVWLIT